MNNTFAKETKMHTWTKQVTLGSLITLSLMIGLGAAEPSSSQPTTAQPLSAGEKLAIPSNSAGRENDLAIDPKFYRGTYFKNSAGSPPCAPANRWTPESRAAYEAKNDWFHKARYGIMFHFIAGWQKSWTSEKWNAWIDAIDVDKFADQAKEVGAGYVVMLISQVDPYYCAPNPVLEKYWGLKPGQFGSKRDLPMDLSKALAKRGIRMMLYTHAEGLYGLPLPSGMDKATAYRRWLEVMQWDSDHYGKAVSGWWTDCLAKEVFDAKKSPWIPNYAEDFLAALRHGNPDAIVNGSYDLADFLHGHCGENWGAQRQVLPYFGRWDPEFKIQWHAFQYLGRTWGQPGVAHSTPEMVRYVESIAEGGGVITFDMGATDGKGNGPFLEIPADQMAQLVAIRDALKKVPLADGASMRQKTLERLLMTVKPKSIQLHAAWPLHWSDTFVLNAPQGIQIKGKVEDGVLIKLDVSPVDHPLDIYLPGGQKVK